MGKVAKQTEARKVNVNRSCKSRGCGTKDWCLTSGGSTHILKGMVEKGLERESDDVIVGVKAEGLKRFIVRIAMFKIIHEPEIGWTGKQERNRGILFVSRGVLCMNLRIS